MSETVLVTGGTGYIAGWCIVKLLERGFDVRTTVRSLAKEGAVRAAVAGAGLPAGSLTLSAADLTRDDGWDAAVSGCDYVLHVASPLGAKAGSGRDAFVIPAREGTLRVLRAAVRAGVKRVVMTSAAAAARPPLSSERVSDETIWADPEDPQFDDYRVSKVLAERAGWDFMDTSGRSTEFTTVLPGAVFGPVLTAGHLGSVEIIRRLLEGRPPAVPRLGFWVVGVRDLAELHIRAMTLPEAAGQRFIAAGDFLWMENIAAILRSGLGARAAKVPRRRLPNLAVKVLLPFQPQLRALAPLLGRQFPLTAQKARDVLGFSPRPVEATIVECAESICSAS